MGVEAAGGGLLQKGLAHGVASDRGPPFLPPPPPPIRAPAACSNLIQHPQVQYPRQKVCPGVGLWLLLRCLHCTACCCFGVLLLLLV